MKKKEINSEFCKQYLINKDKFRWFIEKYFGLRKFINLWELAEQDREFELRSELNDIWYDLPEAMFNIHNNPPGWDSFIKLVGR